MSHLLCIWLSVDLPPEVSTKVGVAPLPLEPTLPQRLPSRAIARLQRACAEPYLVASY